jgi:internalin A
VWTLYLEGNQVANLQGIGSMKWLSMLSLKGNGVTDISPLEPLTELQFLFLEGNKITDLTPLHRMWKKDNDGAREWAPYCQLFIEGNPIDEPRRNSSRR